MGCVDRVLPSRARLNHAGQQRRRIARLFTGVHAAVYRATGGRVGASWSRAPVIVIETVGRRSGKRRSTPVLGLRQGDALVVMPAAAGSDRVPAWWLNLRDAGEGVAVVGRERRRVRPRVAEGAERERLWTAFARMYPDVEAYRTFTDRELPVVVLERVG